jgi:hypothetical protein
MLKSDCVLWKFIFDVEAVEEDRLGGYPLFRHLHPSAGYFLDGRKGSEKRLDSRTEVLQRTTTGEKRRKGEG